MNITELKDIDIKNIDMATLQATLLKRQDVLANLVIVVITLFVVINLITSKENEREHLLSTIPGKQKKIEAIEQNKKAGKQFDEFFNALPKGLPDNMIIDKLTDFAEKHHVQITNFSPTRSENDKLYDRGRVNIDIVAPSYKDLWLFVYDIENSGYNLRVDTWSATLKPQDAMSLKIGKKDDEEFTSQIGISCINYKK